VSGHFDGVLLDGRLLQISVEFMQQAALKIAQRCRGTSDEPCLRTVYPGEQVYF
jgi:hypothetical protein